MVFFAALTFVSLLERGVNFWLALVDHARGDGGARPARSRSVVLRPLVNQPPITLFMATIGLTFVIEGLAQLIWGSQPHGLELGVPDVPMEWLSQKHEHQHQPVRPLRGRRAPASWSRCSRVFFQKTAHRARAARGGRRPPGGAGGRHPAAADLGHRLGGRRIRRARRRPHVGRAERRAVRAHVRRAQGAAGADPRRLRLDRRRDRRRADHRRLGEARRGLPRPVRRRRHRVVVRLRDRARCSCWCGRRGCSARRSSRGSRRCSIAKQGSSRPATPPTSRSSRSCRTGSASACCSWSRSSSCRWSPTSTGSRRCSRRSSSSALAALGLNILTGYAGQLSLGTAAFMAVGAFMAYNFELRIPGMPILGSFILAGLCAALVGHRVRPAQPADQGLLPRGRDAGLPVLRAVGAAARRLVLQLQLLRRHHRAEDRDPRLRLRHAGRQVPAHARDRHRARARWRRTWCAARPAAPSWRCATWTSRRR